MNRRDALTALLGVAGAGATVQAIEAEPKPLLFVLHLDEPVDPENVQCIQTTWTEIIWKNSPPAPLIVIPPGCELEAVLDPRTKEQP